MLEAADMVQVGARNMANSSLLKELGHGRPAGAPQARLRRDGRGVPRTRPSTSSARGNTRVVLCERGVRSFDQVTRNLLDVGAIAHLRAATHLPVIADPSHAAGRSDLVRAIGRAGMAAGADGLMVEVHLDPSAALSDGQQAIGPDELEALVPRRGRPLRAGRADPPEPETTRSQHPSPPQDPHPPPRHRVRTPYVAGNWKMNLDRRAARDLAVAVRDHAASGVDVGPLPRPRCTWTR